MRLHIHKIDRIQARLPGTATLALALVLTSGWNAAGAAPATVAGVQTPAWVERAGARALAAGRGVDLV